MMRQVQFTVGHDREKMTFFVKHIAAVREKDTSPDKCLLYLAGDPEPYAVNAHYDSVVAAIDAYTEA